MGTTIRNTVSQNNPYFLDKHEYLMTRHFALQYPAWKKQKHEIESKIAYGFNPDVPRSGDISKPVERAQEMSESYSNLIDLVEQTAKIAGEDIWEFVLLGATTECSYNYLRMMKHIPCCKDTYYKMYRKFFWLLNCELYKLLNGTKSIFKEE